MVPVWDTHEFRHL